MKKLTILFILTALIFVTSFSQETSTQFKPSGKVFGEVFGDYFYKVSSDDILESTGGQYQKVEKNDNAFGLRRFYFGYAYKFSENFSVKLMFEGNDGQLLTNGKKSVNVKYYYLKWKNIIPGSDLIIGGQSTPTWSRFTEKIWGYRSIEKTIMDFRKQGGSNDFGISLSGKFNEEKTIGYNLMVGNGTGQKPEQDTYKKLYASINAKLLNKKLLLELYTDFEQKEDIDKVTIKGFVGYQNDHLTIGIEPFQRILKQDTAKNVTTFGSTFFIRGTLIKSKLAIFGRFDMFRPEKAVALYNENFSVIGLDFTPNKGIHFMPNIWINSYSELNDSAVRSSDVVVRMTFWYKI